ASAATRRQPQVPAGFRELLQDFAVAVLRQSPDDANFAIEYFTRLRIGRMSSQKPVEASLAPPAEKEQQDSETPMSPKDVDEDEPPITAPPPRRGTRRVAVAGESFDPEKEDPADAARPIVTHPKSDEQRRRLNQAVSHIVLFQCLDEDQKRDVINAMFERRSEPGDRIITQGEDGDNFYVIESGVYDIYVLIDGKDTKVGQYNNQGSFGELALMYNAPRAATIVCAEPGSLWAMDRDTFRRLVLKKAFQKRVMYETLLESVPLLKQLAPVYACGGRCKVAVLDVGSFERACSGRAWTSCGGQSTPYQQQLATIFGSLESVPDLRD
uniref:Cyclic nucleotide-binding domain-containing protein n=1 Tax=Macrostomum lignano TaxID=282301 RepID=A0A1I8FNU8_9PLAT